jgi:hemolysin III
MSILDLREPVNALSHGIGMILALPVTWVLWRRCHKLSLSHERNPACASFRYHRVKAHCMLLFGVCLTACYGISATFHGVRLGGEGLHRLHRLDHVGIYLLIAGTYTPVAWALMRRSWTWGTLTTVWTFALACAFRVWNGGVLPMWVSTLLYLTLGWGAIFCYFELAKRHSHATLLPLPLGGMLYSVGAIFNLARWPVLVPGVMESHEVFHLFVVAGSACHVFFMGYVVAPSPASARLTEPASTPRPMAKPRRQRLAHAAGRFLPHLNLQRQHAKIQ